MVVVVYKWASDVSYSQYFSFGIRVVSPVMAIPTLLMLFLASLATQPALNAEASYCNRKRMSVPGGITVGTQMEFWYNGNDLGVVTLSIKDSIGESLHVEIRHNEKCQGNQPQILMTTKTNGLLDEGQVWDVSPGLVGNLFWTVTAQETGFLLKQEALEIYFTLKYHPSHQLSDVSLLQVSADKGCGVKYTAFEGEIVKFKQPILPDVSKITVQVSCLSVPLKDGRVARMGFGYRPKPFYQVSLRMVYGQYRLLYNSYEYGYRNVQRTLKIPKVYDFTSFTAVLERIEGGRWELTFTIGYKTLKIDIEFPDDKFFNFAQISGFSNIQKIEYEY